MLALIAKDGRVELGELPPPIIENDTDVKVKVKCAAVCPSDVANVEGIFGVTPEVAGHEIAGEVVAVGATVGKLKVGDRVVLQPTIYCGACPACREGNWHLCPNRKFVSLHVHGGFAEELVAPEVNWVPIPDSVSFRHACLVEPLACVIHAVDRFGSLPDKGIIITGAGYSVFLFVQVLVAKGIPTEKVLVSGRRDRRLEIIRELGAHIVDVRKESLAERAEAVFGEAGPELLVDLTGDVQVIRAALDILARQGTLFIYDYFGSEIPFHFGLLQLREITIKTSTGCPHTMRRALAMMESGEVDPLRGVTHYYAPSQMREAYEILKTKDLSHVKSLIEFP